MAAPVVPGRLLQRRLPGPALALPPAADAVGAAAAPERVPSRRAGDSVAASRFCRAPGRAPGPPAAEPTDSAAALGSGLLHMDGAGTRLSSARGAGCICVCLAPCHPARRRLFQALSGSCEVQAKQRARGAVLPGNRSRAPRTTTCVGGAAGRLLAAASRSTLHTRTRASSPQVTTWSKRRGFQATADTSPL